MLVCNFNKPGDAFSKYWSSLCDGTSGVILVYFCCESAVLKILECLIKVDWSIISFFFSHLCHQQYVQLLICFRNKIGETEWLVNLIAGGQVNPGVTGW